MKILLSLCAVFLAASAHASVCVVTADLDVKNAGDSCSKTKMVFTSSCDGNAQKTVKYELTQKPGTPDVNGICTWSNQAQVESQMLKLFADEGYQLVSVSGVSFYLRK
ncbi:MAG: hypothetical protein ACXVBE_11465 [Bdellovibrionota bacterium]